MFSNTLLFIGGLSIFMIGLNFLKTNLYSTNSDKIKTLLEQFTSNNLRSFIFGIFATVILQSSSAFTALIIAFLGSNLIPLKPAILLILASNIGTCFSPFIYSLNINNFSFLFLFAGLILIIFKKHKYNILGNIIIDIGFIFLGITLLNQSISYLNSLGFFNVFFKSNNNLFTFLISILLTCITQSSSLIIAITQTLYQNNIFNLSKSLIFVLGSNVGTCFATYLYTLSFSKKVKFAIKTNIFFNLFAAIIFFLFIKYFLDFTLYLKSILSLNKPATIALFQLIFNVLPTLIIFLFYNKIYCFIIKYFFKD